MKRSAPGDTGPSRRNDKQRARNASHREEEQDDSDDHDTGGAASSEGLKNSPNQPTTQQQSNTAGQEEPSQPNVTYPNPKSFAERLMYVLESDAAPDTIWWEGDGTTVALCVDKLKTGAVLKTHFQGIKYKFFIRYFSRWGFRRITDFSVPYGLFYYKNSLFQRDRPHLVMHMRMDSDVQNVFAQHEAGDNSSQPSDNQSVARLSRDQQQEQSGHHPQSNETQSSTRQQQDNTNNSDHRQQQQQQHSQQQQPIEESPLVQQLRDILGQNVSLQGETNSGASLGSRPATSQHQDMTTFMPSMTNQQPESQQQPARSIITRDFVLQQILRLTTEYLSQTAREESSASSPFLTTVRTILQLLQVVGQQVIQQLRQEEATSSSGLSSAAQQLLDFLQSPASTSAANNPNHNNNQGLAAPSHLPGGQYGAHPQGGQSGAHSQGGQSGVVDHSSVMLNLLNMSAGQGIDGGAGTSNIQQQMLMSLGGQTSGSHPPPAAAAAAPPPQAARPTAGSIPQQNSSGAADHGQSNPQFQLQQALNSPEMQRLLAMMLQNPQR